MIAITKYKANDGTEFDSEFNATQHEQLCERIRAIIAPLGPTEGLLPGCEFGNGGGYLQHDEETVRQVKLGLLREAQQLTDHKWIQQSIDNPDGVHESYAGRIISEISVPLRMAWSRIACIDKQFREWGQPYYANNPGEGTDKRLN